MNDPLSGVIWGSYQMNTWPAAQLSVGPLGGVLISKELYRSAPTARQLSTPMVYVMKIRPGETRSLID